MSAAALLGPKRAWKSGSFELSGGSPNGVPRGVPPARCRSRVSLGPLLPPFCDEHRAVQAAVWAVLPMAREPLFRVGPNGRKGCFFFPLSDQSVSSWHAVTGRRDSAGIDTFPAPSPGSAAGCCRLPGGAAAAHLSSAGTTPRAWEHPSQGKGALPQLPQSSYAAIKCSCCCFDT